MSTSIYISVDSIYMIVRPNFKIVIFTLLEIARPSFVCAVIKCIVSHLFSSVYAGIDAAIMQGLNVVAFCYILSRGCYYLHKTFGASCN